MFNTFAVEKTVSLVKRYCMLALYNIYQFRINMATSMLYKGIE